MWGEEPDIKWLLHLVSMTIMIVTKSMEQTGCFCYPGSLQKQKKISTGLKFQAQRTSGELNTSVVTLKEPLLSSNYRADKPEDWAENMIVQVAELLHCVNKGISVFLNIHPHSPSLPLYPQSQILELLRWKTDYLVSEETDYAHLENLLKLYQ